MMLMPLLLTSPLASAGGDEPFGGCGVFEDLERWRESRENEGGEIWRWGGKRKRRGRQGSQANLPPLHTHTDNTDTSDQNGPVHTASAHMWRFEE